MKKLKIFFRSGALMNLFYSYLYVYFLIKKIHVRFINAQQQWVNFTNPNPQQALIQFVSSDNTDVEFEVDGIFVDYKKIVVINLHLNKMKKIILILLIFIVCSPAIWGQTHGAVPCEIYTWSGISSINGTVLLGIFYSPDNGQTFSLQYSNTEGQVGVMWTGDVHGDATSGVLFNNYYYGTYELWESFDYGVTWEEVDGYGYPKYATGCMEGEIYRSKTMSVFY